MEAQDQQGDSMTVPQVIATLLDLARLAHRIELAAPEAPGTIATLLLERLIMVCKAQRGAIVFPPQRPVEHKPSIGTSAIAVKDTPQARLQAPIGTGQALRTLALDGMHEEQVLALLEGCSSDGMDIQSPPGEPCCVICRLPISAPSDHQQDRGAAQDVTRSDLVQTRRAGARPAVTPLPVYALLVLLWDDNVANDERACIAAEEATALLPLIADAAGTVIMHLLLVERVYELEAMSDRKALRDMELLKAELLATVSHELRSPLASIKGYAATLLRHERRISREERRQFLLAINEASDRLEVIIERLLEMSQLETGEVTIQRSVVDPAHLTAEAIAAIEERISEQLPGRFTFTLSLEHTDGTLATGVPLILADQRRLREVLDNLLENAVKYSPGGGVIKVILRPVTHMHTTQGGLPSLDQNDAPGRLSTQTPRRMLEILVCDTGMGIPDEHLERIFDRFHRVDTRPTREVDGLGVGLAICKRIVELHNGLIWAENRSNGKGSVFHVRLPIDEIPTS